MVQGKPPCAGIMHLPTNADQPSFFLLARQLVPRKASENFEPQLVRELPMTCSRTKDIPRHSTCCVLNTANFMHAQKFQNSGFFPTQKTPSAEGGYCFNWTFLKKFTSTQRAGSCLSLQARLPRIRASPNNNKTLRRTEKQ